MTEGAVQILMATLNGAPHLPDQLASFLAQDHENWSLLVSDDGSMDETRGLIARFQTANPGRRIELSSGPGRGFAVNFLNLIGHCDRHCEAAALSDQDDVWLPAKIARGLKLLRGCVPGRPALYFGRTRIADDTLRPSGLSPLFRHQPCFRNALVQSIGGGNTMMLNRAAIDLVAAAGTPDVVSHDWWIYQLVTGAGGQVIYDPQPFLLYRQHAANTFGSNRGAKAAFSRIRGLAEGRYRGWIDRNVDALFSVQHLLSSEALQTLEAFHSARSRAAWYRPGGLVRAGVYRQGTLGQASLLMASCLGKV